MDIFRVHRQLIDDYRSFTTSSVTPLDARIAQHVSDELAQGKQWPEPWLSLNPTFASGGSIDDLVAEGLLHPECSRIFRPKRDEADTGRRPITLHVHQRQAIETARSGTAELRPSVRTKSGRLGSGFRKPSIELKNAACSGIG